MKDVEKYIKSYYNNKSLSVNQLEAIKGRLERRSMFRHALKYAAVALTLVVAISTYYYIQIYTPNQLLKSYAEEVMFNHKKKLTSDIITNDIAMLNIKMKKLNFELVLPQNIGKKYTLLGGRYCSVNQRIAAQLKLKNAQNKILTLYVLDKLENEKIEKHFTIDDTQVDIWNDDNRVFLLAISK